MLYAKSVSLTNLVEHVNTVHFEDSVLALSTLSKAELTELIDKLIDDERQAEEERRFRQQELAEQQIDIQSNRNGFNLANSGSKWYFYNPAIKNIGRKEFGQIWGNRKLEDNWRRKNKSSLSFADLKVDDQLSDMEQQAPDKINGLVTNKRSREFYLQYIPFTDSARQESHDKIAFGLFNMGEIYGAELKDSEKAINAYEELLERYPGYENRLQVYYKLYSIAKLEKDKSRVGIYQQKIVSEFPNSNFAKLMTNPNYVEELLAQDRKVIDEYIATYQLFQLGRFDQVSMRSHKAMEQYPDHELYSRFDYMYTVSAGLRKDTLRFVNDLQNLIAKYPTTDLAENAQIMIAYLQNKEPKIIEMQNREMAKKLFIESFEEEHYFAYIVPSITNVNQLIFNIINFNLDYFDELKLEVKKVNLDSRNNLCLVRKFKDSEEAISYLKQIIMDKNIFVDVEIEEFIPVVISQTNFKAFTGSGKAEQYILFFKDNYNY
ncbi:hypothetical protein ES705_18902 [subsurface metagenome]